MKREVIENIPEQFTQVIKPGTGLFELNLKEVWRYRDLLFLFVKRDFSAQYKQTILGPLWHFLQPALTAIMFLILFGKIANIPTDGIEPILFYLSGITLWNYFSACLTSTATTFTGNAAIFGKVYFPRLVLPLSVILSNLIRFGIQFLLLLLVMIAYAFKANYFYIGWSWLWIPALLLLMAMFGLGFGIIISSLTTKYRDFAVLLSFAVQLAMYITPVAYPMSFLKSKSYATWIQWNPLTPVIETFRYALFGVGQVNYGSLLYSLGVTIVALVIGLLLFNKVEKTFMDTV
ncbi:MAG: ABC transporter permease [Chitinophagaceae bacterium]|nr:ABC transporter permease [Bacteroidota bacterium]MCC6256847.1 ABC transporter permease [Chitinophagaceae bacterium]